MMYAFDSGCISQFEWQFFRHNNVKLVIITNTDMNLRPSSPIAIFVI